MKVSIKARAPVKKGRVDPIDDRAKLVFNKKAEMLKTITANLNRRKK